jgi:hypothetical protein
MTVWAGFIWLRIGIGWLDLWMKLHKEELHNLYSSPNTIRMIELRRMRWSGHVA